MATVETLLTAEEYQRLPDNGRPSELVRGRIVEMNIPAPRHGYFCGKVVQIIGRHSEDHDLGRVVSNDAGVVTEHNPDTVRGPDVCFYSFARLPRGPLPEGYLNVAPEAAFEVRSPTDRRSEILAKVAELLRAGVIAVCVLDPQTETVTIYREDSEPDRVLRGDAEFGLPDILPGLSVPVRRFFE
jgi:Uma2 family endonuclease